MTYKLVEISKNNESPYLITEQDYISTRLESSTPTTESFIVNGEKLPENICTVGANGERIFVEKKLYFSEGRGFAFEIDFVNKTKKPLFENERVYFMGIVKSNFIIINYTDKVISNYQIIGNDFIAYVNSKTFETIWTTKKIFTYNILSDNNYIYAVNNDYRSIRCISIATGDDIWEFSVKKLGEYKTENKEDGLQEGQVSNLIAIHDERLIVQITGYREIVLDCATGEVLWMIDDFRNYLPEEIRFTIGLVTNGEIGKGLSNWHLISETNKMYLCWFAFVFEIDLEKQSLEVIYNNFKKVTFSQSERVGNLIYVVSSSDYYMYIFDIEKKEIIWTFEYPQKTYLSGYIKVHKDKIYLRDWNDNLLILERE